MNKQFNITSAWATKLVRSKFLQRFAERKLTRKENPLSHFCVYFAAYDPQKQLVFLGHHKKSGLWLFNGGHMEPKEKPIDTIRREISEEWGIKYDLKKMSALNLLTLTEIEHSEKIICREHFDLWYFLPVEKKTFSPDPKKLAEEFFTTRWLTITQAQQFTRDPATQQALRFLQKTSV